MAESYPDEAEAAEEVRESETSDPGATDAPEADALEQARGVEDEEEDERR